MGDAVRILDELRQSHNVTHVWAHEETGNLATFARDRAVISWAQHHSVTFTEIPQTGVVRRLRNREDWGNIRKQRLSQPVVSPPQHITAVNHIRCDDLPPAEDLILNYRQHGGETVARALLSDFLQHKVEGYERTISSPITAWDGCSRLSPYLAYGCVSSREVIREINRHKRHASLTQMFSLDAFEQRLAWRDHFMQKLESNPFIEERSYFPEFDAMRQRLDERKLNAWVTGHTGYPFVDACLRALAATGWMNFRMRAMLVSFAAHDLWLPWQAFGSQLAKWFVDYEPGIHWSQIQMQSGTTSNVTMRVYNPIKQGRDHDPDGVYIRTWVPELREVRADLIHEPWLHLDQISESARSYPLPIVDHVRATQLATREIDKTRRLLGLLRRR
jgi:deoxyribodipyrimidine photo-lyase